MNAVKKLKRKVKKKEKAIPENAREALISVAKIHFGEKGFDGVSVRELCEAAKVNTAAINYHFESKEGLYRSCFVEFGAQRLEVALRILIPVTTIEEFGLRLSLFADEMLTAHFKERDLMKMVHREIESVVPHIEDIFRQTFLKFFMALENYFKSAQERKLLRSEFDPNTIACIFMGAISHQLRMEGVAKRYFSRSLQDKNERDFFKDNLIQLFVAGLKRV